MGEYEPDDSRNMTGTASTPNGRWTNKDGKPPVGVPDEKPASAKDATERRDEAEPDAQPPLSDEPPIENRDELPGTPRPAKKP